MPGLVTKFHFIKPGGHGSTYAKYIATREGVEYVSSTKGLLPATDKQKRLISNITKDLPDSKDSPEYQSYLEKPDREHASKFLVSTIESNIDVLDGSKTYADYIATRPRAEKLGTHGLFTDSDEPIVLSRVSEEIKNLQGNMWTVIFSLKREDATRLGYDNAKSWSELLRSNRALLSSSLHIPEKNLKWYAAFHDEGYHPHIHLIAYSSEPGEGYLDNRGVNNIRSALTNEIFADDMLPIFRQQTEYRDQIRRYGKNIISSMKNTNSIIEMKFLEFAKNLQAEKQGTRYYKYLKPELKQQVDDIAELISRDETVADLYDKWYLEKEKVLLLYEDTLPERIPLAQNDEFRSIKNAIISEAKHYVESIYDISHEFFKINNNENRSDNASDVKFYDVANLINQIASIIESKTFDIRTEYHGKTDKKLLREIAERKLASGQKF